MIEIQTVKCYSYSQKEEVISKFKEKAESLIERNARSENGQTVFCYTIITNISNTTINNDYMYYCGELVYETYREMRIK